MAVSRQRPLSLQRLACAACKLAYHACLVCSAVLSLSWCFNGCTLNVAGRYFLWSARHWRQRELQSRPLLECCLCCLLAVVHRDPRTYTGGNRLTALFCAGPHGRTCQPGATRLYLVDPSFAFHSHQYQLGVGRTRQCASLLGLGAACPFQLVRLSYWYAHTTLLIVLPGLVTSFDCCRFMLQVGTVSTNDQRAELFGSEGSPLDSQHSTGTASSQQQESRPKAE